MQIKKMQILSFLGFRDNFVSLCLGFRDNFVSLCCVFAIILMFAVGLQSLLFWVGGLLPAWRIGCLSMGVILNLLVFASIIWLFSEIGSNQYFFPYKGTAEKGAFSGFTVMLLPLCVYICVTSLYSWLALMLMVLLLVLCIRRLTKIEADVSRLGTLAGGLFVYCLGGYFAMLINGLEPAIDVYGLTLLAFVTIVLWFNPIFDY